MTGDLIVWPVPLVGSTSFPADYSATLEKLLTIPAQIIVPGHGPVLRGQEYLKQMAHDPSGADAADLIRKLFNVKTPE